MRKEVGELHEYILILLRKRGQPMVGVAIIVRCQRLHGNMALSLASTVRLLV